MGTAEEDYEALTREYLRRNRALGRHLFEFQGLVFEIFEEVFSPHVFGDTAFFAREMAARAGKRMLEVGCGAGVIATWAALAGCDQIVATDLNPAASANTRQNATRHGVAAKVEVRHGDLFEAVAGGERFDSIFWNPPFIPIENRLGDYLEISVFDFGYRSLRRYLVEGRRYLAPEGRLYFGFSSSSGDIARLRAIAAEQGLELRLRASTEIPDAVNPGFSLELYEAKGPPE